MKKKLFVRNIMDYKDLKYKYEQLEDDFESKRITSRMNQIEELDNLRRHPVNDTRWINYARDQKFDFNCLQLPDDPNSDWYKSVHSDMEKYLELMTLFKEFVICDKCGTKWTLNICLDGSYSIYDQCGIEITNWNNEENLLNKLYKIPKRIKTVRDLMYLIDVIELNSHK